MVVSYDNNDPHKKGLWGHKMSTLNPNRAHVILA